MKQRALLLFLVTIVTYWPARAQQLLTLDDAIGLALAHNQWVQVSHNNAEMAANSAHPGNAGMLPRLDFSSGITYNDNLFKNNSGNLAEKSTTSTAGLTASMTLFNGFGNLFTYKRLQNSTVIAKLTAQNNIENELLSVISSYFAVARSAEQLTIATESVTISSERYERAQKRSAFGQANKISVLNAEVDLNADSVAYYNAVLAYDETRRNLNVLLNRDIATDYAVDSAVEFDEGKSLDSIQNKALHQNAAYTLNVYNLKQAKYDLRIVKSAYLPQLNLQSRYGYNQLGSNFSVGLDDPNRTFSAGATLSLNLFDGLQKRTRRQNAQLQINNQKLLLDEARRELERTVKNTFASYQNSRYMLRVQQGNLLSAQLNFERTHDLYELGQVTSTQFREAQLNLIRAKTNISNAKFDAKLYEFQLMKLAGELVVMNE